MNNLYSNLKNLFQVKIVHVDEENGLLPMAYRIIVSYHAYYKPYTVLLKVSATTKFLLSRHFLADVTHFTIA